MIFTKTKQEKEEVERIRAQLAELEQRAREATEQMTRQREETQQDLARLGEELDRAHRNIAPVDPVAAAHFRANRPAIIQSLNAAIARTREDLAAAQRRADLTQRTLAGQREYLENELARLES